MSDPFTATELLGVLTVSGLLGMVGQGARAVAGLKKMSDAAEATEVSSADLFRASRLVISLIIGFIAGVAAALMLGIDKLLKFDAGNVQLLLGIAAAGYVGADFVEAFAKNLAKVEPVKVTGFGQPAPSSPHGPLGPLGPPAGEAPAPPTKAYELAGRMSTFGGPHDTGMSASEGLAILDDADLAAFNAYFLPEQPPGTSGLGRRLNPDAFYIACRWNYDVTPRRHLKAIKVQVTNPASGKTALAQPVDWGPHIATGRVTDLSPGIARNLGLETDNECRVLVPLPADAPSLPPPGAPRPPPGPIVVTEHLHVLRNESDIRRHFGDFSHSEAGGGRIVISDDWADENIVEVTIEELKHLVRNGRFECHKAIEMPLKAAFAEIGRRNLIDRILKWDGCWVPRHMGWDPDRSLSRHSWAIAFDINADWNGYGHEPKAKGERGSVVELVPIFESFGFAWGGFFRPDSLRDGMHFEFCKPAADA
jgi:hypothetical protein